MLKQRSKEQRSHLQHSDGTHVTLIRWSIICRLKRWIEAIRHEQVHAAIPQTHHHHRHHHHHDHHCHRHQHHHQHHHHHHHHHHHLLEKADEASGGERPALTRDAQKLQQHVRHVPDRMSREACSRAAAFGAGSGRHARRRKNFEAACWGGIRWVTRL